MRGASAIVHVGPAVGAAFTEYTAEFEPQGELGHTSAQRFLYVMEGVVTLEAEGKRQDLAARGYAYLPEGLPHRAIAKENSRVAVIEKPYLWVVKIAPHRLPTSSADAVSSHPLKDHPDLQVKCLIPDTPSFDFAVKTPVNQTDTN